MKKNRSHKRAHARRLFVPTLLCLSLFPASFALAEDYNGSGLAVSGTSSYDNVSVSDTIHGNWMVDITGSGNLTVGNGLDISATDSGSTGFVVGLGVSGNGQVNVTDGTTIAIDSTSTSGSGTVSRVGINLDGNTRVQLGKDSLVSIDTVVENGTINGAYLNGGSTMTGENLEMRLNNASGETVGIFVDTGDNSMTFDRLDISATGLKKAGDEDTWAQASGIFSDQYDGDRTTLVVRDLEIDAGGTDFASAITAYGAMTLDNSGKTVLRATASGTDGSNAYGIEAEGYQDGDIAMHFGTLAITAESGTNSTGISLSSDEGSNTIAAKSLAITATGAGNADGIIMNGGQMTVEGAMHIASKGGERAKGISMLYGGQLDVGKSDPAGTTLIETRGDFSYGIDIGRGDSGATFHNKTVITAESTKEQAFGVYVRHDTASDPMTGTVAFNNGLSVTTIGGTDENTAIYAHGPGARVIVENGLEAKAEKTAVFAHGSDDANTTSVTINENGGTTRIDSDRRALGAYGNASIDVGGDRVQINGDILSVGTENGRGVINAAFRSGDSWLTGTVSNKRYAAITTDGTVNLDFSSGARWNVTGSSSLDTLSLDNAAIDMTRDGNGFSHLEIADLKGTGTFRMDVDVDGQRNDTISVSKTSGGPTSHVIDIASSGKASVDSSAVMIRSAAGTQAGFELRNTAAGNKIDLGNYLYELVYSDDSAGNREWRLGKAGFSPSAEAVAALAGSGAQTAQYLNRLSDLYKRLGEVRYGARDGLWASVQGRKDRISGFAGTGFKQSVYGVSVGYDRTVGSWVLGGSFNAMLADQKTHDTRFSATGDADSQGFNLYATYMGQSGGYADIVLTVDRYGQDIETRMLDGKRVKGSYSSMGYGVSGEIGKRFGLGADGSFFVEPQAQLSWYRVQGKNFSLSNEMSVSQDDMDSLNGRLGFLFGRKFRAKDNTWAQVYFKGGVNHEFLDDQKIRINDVKYSDDFIGTRGYYGFGLDWQFSRNARLWAQLEREEGNGYTKEIEASIGVKYRF